MKKTILIGAVLVAVTVAFLYVPRVSVSVPASVSATTSPITNTNATLTVGETVYSMRAGESLLNAMRTLAAASTFTFTGREYPGLGFFVDSINGEKNGGGKYWVFYINGVSAPMGVSATLLQAGDIIEWKYEKGY